MKYRSGRSRCAITRAASQAEPLDKRAPTRLIADSAAASTVIIGSDTQNGSFGVQRTWSPVHHVR